MKKIYFGCLLGLSLVTFTLASSAQCPNQGCKAPGGTPPDCYSCSSNASDTGYSCSPMNCKSCLESQCQSGGGCDPSVDFGCDPLITDARPAIPEFQNAPFELKHSLFPNRFLALSKPRQFECKPPTLPTNVLFTL